MLILLLFLKHSWETQMTISSGDVADSFKYLIEMYPVLWMKSIKMISSTSLPRN